MIAVLYVCQANICRSVALQGFLEKLIADDELERFYHVDSCGLHPGSNIDEATLAEAKKRGVELVHIPRALELADFCTFDYILAATASLQKTLLSQDPFKTASIHLATHFSTSYKGEDLPDPYSQGFDKLFDMVQDAALSFFNYLKNSP
ncbi:MAG: hypothetical protein FJZ63_03420 [Chlamydiae bacterium]|nr:hypothetical protein [Chlamydiota bacterium]